MPKVTASKMHPVDGECVMMLMDQETANYLYARMEFTMEHGAATLDGSESPDETLMRVAIKSALSPVTQVYRR